MRVFAHTRAAYLCEELVGNRGEAENVGTHKGAGASASASDIPSIVANTAASAIVARRTKPPDRLRLAALLMATAADVEAPADAVADGPFNPVGLGRFFVDAPMSYYVPEKRDTNRAGFGVQPNGAKRAGFGVALTRSEKTQRPEVRRALGLLVRPNLGCRR